MRFGLQKLGRYAAGRLQGSKGVQKYDKFMDENAAVRGLLTAGDIAGATLGGAALLGGGSIGAGLGKIGAGAAKAGSGVKSLLTGNANVGGALKSAGSFAKENKDLIALAGKGIGSMLPDAASDAAMMRAETERMSFEENKAERQREEERRRRLAELLMPMYERMNQTKYF